mmetsp:Transcript_3074/g.7330  ORF Transcript_3074/g.7330 Transcript_3074/m.7330 type:complete len:213 (+) Transcript_3074:1309-1947(+)
MWGLDSTASRASVSWEVPLDRRARGNTFFRRSRYEPIYSAPSDAGDGTGRHAIRGLRCCTTLATQAAQPRGNHVERRFSRSEYPWEHGTSRNPSCRCHSAMETTRAQANDHPAPRRGLPPTVPTSRTTRWNHGHSLTHRRHKICGLDFRLGTILLLGVLLTILLVVLVLNADVDVASIVAHFHNLTIMPKRQRCYKKRHKSNGDQDVHQQRA